VWEFLGFNRKLQNGSWDHTVATPIAEGQHLRQPEILFKKIEDEQIEAEAKWLAELSQKSKKKSYPPLKPPIDFADFDKIDLRVGTITSAVAVPKSKKLLKLQVDLGFEERTVISGISQHYTPEQLVGKKIVLVANLKPAVLMGIESKGMVLAASNDEVTEVLHINAVDSGQSIH
jgi:methionyl-tRNA synthetase